jgi:RNA polymerase sigma-32 factor
MTKGKTKSQPKSPKKTVAKKAAGKTSEKSVKGYRMVEAEVVDGEIDSVPDIVEPSESDLGAEVPAAPEIDQEIKSLAPTDPVTRYMQEIGRYKLLTREEEQELALRYRETGDPLAAEKLVTSNLRFVVKIAAEYTRFGARLIDLVQEGNVGLMHAVKEFNPYKGVRLITYAVWWIRGYIQEFLMRQYSMVRIGTTANQRKLFYQLQKEREQLERMGLEQGFAQLSGRLGVPKEEVQEMHARLSGRDVSLDAPVGEDGSARLLDLQSEADPQSLEDALGSKEQIGQLMAAIEQLRDALNERELFILEERILADDPLTLQDIGDKYGTTREAVRQMEVRLIEKIKKALVSN